MGLPKRSLILGGAASGKSSFAENLCVSSDLPLIYVATAQIFDDEMRQKVADHISRRGPDWTTIEEPLELAAVLAGRKAGEVVLVDCLTLWLTNLLLAEREAEAEALAPALNSCAAHLVIVSNEVGAGIVPENALARRFRNAQGRLNQQIAAECDLVVNVVAGLPMVLKGALP